MTTSIGDEVEIINMAATVGRLVGLWRAGELHAVAGAVADFTPEHARLALLTSLNLLAAAKLEGEQ